MTSHNVRRALGLFLMLLTTLPGFSCASQPADESLQNSNKSTPAPPSSSTPPIQPNSGLGSIKVGSRPSGATVLLISEEEGVTGRPQLRGSTPTLITDVAPGKYAVHLELRGYEAFQKSIEVRPGESVSVTATLKRQ